MSTAHETYVFPDYPATLDRDSYEILYELSLHDSEAFWGRFGKVLDWFAPFSKVRHVEFDEGKADIRWFEDGALNASFNCVDRHLRHRGGQTAIIWEGDEPGVGEKITYAELHEAVCRLANGLKTLGVEKGDRVVIYLPMIPEVAIAMLACARIGAVHSVVFGGFSADSLASRINDCDARVVITANEGLRGGRRIPLKKNVDEALANCPQVMFCIVVRRTSAETSWTGGRDVDYGTLVDSQLAACPPKSMNAEDPLFILYTSGSTGQPKGVVHTTGGYLVACSLTHRYLLDCQEGDVFWCTADVGWVTGHSYVVYGPLANGTTTVMFEGVPTYPTPARYWQICERHGVNVLYTAPTAIRSLMREGDDFVTVADRNSLRLLGSVGEPINPEAWRWYHDVVGERRCPVVDTWWQTETGSIQIAPVPGALPLKPGSATLPFFGVRPVLVDERGNRIDGPGEGFLCLEDAGPGMMRTIFRDAERFIETYFRRFPGLYFTGDGCRRDEDGYYWITGRVDDVINVSGHRLGTAEIESALVAHPGVAEAAVVARPDEVKGNGIHAFVTLKSTTEASECLRRDLLNQVRRSIGPIAEPDILQWAPSLPKTRSGKIMRRILRRIAEGADGGFGDLSTLANPAVVEELLRNFVRDHAADEWSKTGSTQASR